MEQLTTLDELRRQIRVLACIDETEAPFVSCYLDLEQGEAGYRKAFEDRASVLRAARFVQGIRTQGLAAAGAAACLDALRQGRVDVLLLARDYLPEPGWRCASCGAMHVERDVPATCPRCGKATLRPIDATEELVRLAGQQNCPVEVVEHCDPLMALGGVGCLLRYRETARKQDLD